MSRTNLPSNDEIKKGYRWTEMRTADPTPDTPTEALVDRWRWTGTGMVRDPNGPWMENPTSELDGDHGYECEHCGSRFPTDAIPLSELEGLLAKALVAEPVGLLQSPGRLKVEWPTAETYERRAAALAAAIRELL